MTIREKVARAICQEGSVEHGGCEDIDCDCPFIALNKTEGNQAAAAIAVFLEAAAEDGWHMRPDEATEEMVGVVVDACRAEDIEIFREDEDALPGVVWKAMLIFAPEFEWDK